MESAQFWDGLHAAHKEANDWYLHANDCYTLLKPLLPVKAGTKCLHIGCGTSDLGDLLGRTCDVLNIDFSTECIEYHRRRDPAGSYAVMDVTDMHEVVDASFELIVDKGTMDSLQRDAESAHPGTVKAVAEMLRVAGPNGSILMISMVSPKYREPCLLACLRDLHSPRALEVHTWDVVPFEEPSQSNVWLYVIHPCDNLSAA
jgi:ubiquinone/menaquinone biosynthesis C-methylase UbiE